MTTVFVEQPGSAQQQWSRIYSNDNYYCRGLLFTGKTDGTHPSMQCSAVQCNVVKCSAVHCSLLCWMTKQCSSVEYRAVVKVQCNHSDDQLSRHSRHSGVLLSSHELTGKHCISATFENTRATSNGRVLLIWKNYIKNLVANGKER